MFGKSRNNRETVSSFPRRPRENKYSMYRLVSAVGILLAFGLLLMMGAQYIQQLRIRQELTDYEAKVLDQELRHEELSVEIERLRDHEYIEIQARDRLGLVKPDEIIFQLED